MASRITKARGRVFGAEGDEQVEITFTVKDVNGGNEQTYTILQAGSAPIDPNAVSTELLAEFPDLDLTGGL